VPAVPAPALPHGHLPAAAVVPPAGAVPAPGLPAADGDVQGK